LTEQ